MIDSILGSYRSRRINPAFYLKYVLTPLPDMRSGELKEFTLGAWVKRHLGMQAGQQTASQGAPAQPPCPRRHLILTNHADKLPVANPSRTRTLPQTDTIINDSVAGRAQR